MNFTLKFFLATMMGLFLFPGIVGADTTPPAEGGVLPPISLDVPQSAKYQHYLGIAGKNKFMIPEIKAEIVLIEIFSMY
jgi:hypothetical protein